MLQVVSGCEWGNILLWDESLIKLEACRKGGQALHASYITQFEYYTGELISVGNDTIGNRKSRINLRSVVSSML